jgi:hypothetical protein
LSADLLATKRSLAEAQKDLLKRKASYPFDTQRIIDAQLRVEKLTDAIERIEALQAELF